METPCSPPFLTQLRNLLISGKEKNRRVAEILLENLTSGVGPQIGARDFLVRLTSCLEMVSVGNAY